MNTGDPRKKNKLVLDFFYAKITSNLSYTVCFLKTVSPATVLWNR